MLTCLPIKLQIWIEGITGCTVHLHVCQPTHHIWNSCSLPAQSCWGHRQYLQLGWGHQTKGHSPGNDVSAGQQAWNTGWLSLSVPPLPQSRPAVAGYSSHFAFDRTVLPFLSDLYRPSGRVWVAKRELAWWLYLWDSWEVKSHFTSKHTN